MFFCNQVYVIIMEAFLSNYLPDMNKFPSFMRKYSIHAKYLAKNNSVIEEVKLRFPVSPKIVAELRTRLASTVNGMEAFLGHPIPACSPAGPSTGAEQTPESLATRPEAPIGRLSRDRLVGTH